jgi:hypothetical protein
LITQADNSLIPIGDDFGFSGLEFSWVNYDKKIWKTWWSF